MNAIFISNQFIIGDKLLKSTENNIKLISNIIFSSTVNNKLNFNNYFKKYTDYSILNKKRDVNYRKIE